MYKASFKTNDFVSIEGKKCVLPISVGQPYHEGEKLLATIKLINKSRLAYCTIVIADSLQKHNLINDHSPYGTAMLLGDNWLQRNKNILDTLTISYEIIRWDYWLWHDKYLEYKRALESEYHSNPNYRHAVDESINQFIQRKLANNEDIDHVNQKNLFNNSLQYFFEECAVTVCWGLQADGYDYIVYPQTMLHAISMTHEIFIKKAYPNKVKLLSLRFRKHGNLK